MTSSPGETRPKKPPKRSYGRLSRRLEDAGFSKSFVRTALLPEWWTRECQADAALLPQIEFGVARFLGVPLEVVRDPSQPLLVRDITTARLRHAKGAERTKMLPAMHASLSVAGAVVRNLRDVPPFAGLPLDARAWREELLLPHGSEAIGLRRLLLDLWQRGVPVVHLRSMPSPKFRGMACLAEGRPVILLGWGGDELPPFLIDVAHEAGHIACGHITDGTVFLDESGEGEGERDAGAESGGDLELGQQEQEAIEHAAQLLYSLRRKGVLPDFDDSEGLASMARRVGRRDRIDTGLLVRRWARQTGKDGMASAALRLLHQGRGARSLLRSQLAEHLDLEGASETDRRLLQCTHLDDGDLPDAPAD